MDPYTIASIGVPIVTGILGGNAASQQASEAARLEREQLNRILGIATPDIEKMKLTPEEMLSAGQISPEEYQLLGQLQGTELENISTDPRLRQDQMTALDQTRQRALTGFNDEDRAMLDNYMRQATSMAQSQKQGIVEDAARRGMAGSGTSLAAALSGTQGIANQASQQAMSAAASRLQNMNANTNQLAQLSGQIEGSDYGRLANIANRKDSVNEFNQRLRQDTANSNVQLRNQAAAGNLANKQDLMNRNTTVRNDAQQFNRGLEQTRFNNELTKAQAAGGQNNRMADSANSRGQATANQYATIGSGLSGLLSGFSADTKPKVDPTKPTKGG